MSCYTCKYSQLIVNEGEEYVTLNPHGDEVLKVYNNTILICRYSPPINGWPEVLKDDWCSKFEERKN